MYQPEKKDAGLMQAGLADFGSDAGGLFEAKAALMTYEWDGYQLVVLQGPSRVGWTFESEIRRPDAGSPITYRGGRLLILPPIELPGESSLQQQSNAVAYWLLQDWAIRVEAPPHTGAKNDELTADSLARFLDLLGE